ncbi:hypothetical protein ACFQGE_00490 [Halomicroarcula sp. GCM10025817]|nr:hypothetical protein [Halomicroarcula sp. SYNS111]
MTDATRTGALTERCPACSGRLTGPFGLERCDLCCWSPRRGAD